jgi:hypothetical protein
VQLVVMGDDSSRVRHGRQKCKSYISLFLEKKINFDITIPLKQVIFISFNEDFECFS